MLLLDTQVDQWQGLSQAEKTGVSKKYANILAIPLTRNTESSHPTPPGKGREAGEAGKARRGARGARGTRRGKGEAPGGAGAGARTSLGERSGFCTSKTAKVSDTLVWSSKLKALT